MQKRLMYVNLSTACIFPYLLLGLVLHILIFTYLNAECLRQKIRIGKDRKKHSKGHPTFSYVYDLSTTFHPVIHQLTLQHLW
jgi:hypothetical protein